MNVNIGSSVQNARNSTIYNSTCQRIGKLDKHLHVEASFSASRSHISQRISTKSVKETIRTLTRSAESSNSAIETHNENAAIEFVPPTSNVWELDFCSRPILDERGKKVWEVLICDPERNFQYAQFFPNNKINSTEVLIYRRVFHEIYN